MKHPKSKARNILAQRSDEVSQEKDSRSFKDRKQAALKVVQFADIHVEPDYAEVCNTMVSFL